MEHFQRVSQDFVKSLSLQYEPVGVTLYKDSEPLPDSQSFAQGEFKSYCHAKQTTRRSLSTIQRATGIEL